MLLMADIQKFSLQRRLHRFFYHRVHSVHIDWRLYGLLCKILKQSEFYALVGVFVCAVMICYKAPTIVFESSVFSVFPLFFGDEKL